MKAQPPQARIAPARSGQNPLRAVMLRLSGVVEESIVDGPGLRYVLFTQGCPHCCKGCHNPQTHPLEGGFLSSAGEVLAHFAENPLLAGITFSGGEPFLQAGALCAVAEGVRARGKTVLVYTGFTYEQLLARLESEPDARRLLELTDLLIDGPYVEALRDLELRFRGSANQRILDRAAREALRADGAERA